MEELGREGRENELVEFLLNMGDVIKLYRMKRRLRIQDVCRKIKEKFGEEIHPTILSRYENKKLTIKNTHAAYICDVLGIYIEDVFPDKVVLLDLRHFITNLKFQYLVKQLRRFFPDEQIIKMIQDYLQEKLDFAWKIIGIYEHKIKNYQNVSDENQND
ncbi:MAG: hypothetical protein KatS3mg129_2680 [Leptospiraceae bacterium]|nr:MAG: hypothetical protein KatS3mg129_2680 [Leptospiraceae bacterium]